MEISSSKHPVLKTGEERRRRKAEQQTAKRESKQLYKAKEKERKERKRVQARTEKSKKPTRSERSESTQNQNPGPESGHDGDERNIADPIDAKSPSRLNQLPLQNLTEADESDRIGRDEKSINLTVAPTPSPSEVPAPETGDPEHQIQDRNASTATSSEGPASPILSPHNNSGASSTSSIPPLLTTAVKTSTTTNAQPGIASSLSDADQTPRERFEARLSQLRAERKADNSDGRPAKNRQELLEQRRRKEELRRQAKKEQRRKEKEEQARKEDEEMIKRFSPGGSGSLFASPRSPLPDNSNNFTFSRVAFTDGTEADASLSSLIEQRNRKGPSDPASALKAIQNKTSRLSGLDEGRRQTIQQQDMWLNAKRKAHGERVKDDSSLLKKALKRQEGDKKRSENEWSKREEGVRLGMEKRQQKREDNIQRRRAEKKSGGKGKPKLKRPGFEGSFRGRTGGKKKKS